MMWNQSKHCSYSKHYIDAEVQYGSGKTWRCTGFYGHPDRQQKKHTWTLLQRLAGLSSKPWLCFDDFNEILTLNEKTNENYRNVWMISKFREVIRACNLVDMGCKGYLFTQNNGRFGPHYVEERLDMLFCNKE